MSHKLWGGRFTGAIDPLMSAYNDSLRFDRVLWPQDIAGSIAYARANTANGLLTPQEFAAIEKGFSQIAQEWQTDTFEVKSNDEDIHTANERRLGELIGEGVAGKLHTGRSRNDQVATDLRMWVRDELKKLENHLKDLLRVIARRAEKEMELILPG